MGDSQAHVAEWQAAGLIDAATADRIRAHESSAPPSPTAEPRESAVTAMFGPSLTIGEVFSYLGAFFVLAASDAFLARIAAPAPSNDWTLVIGTALQTVVLLAIGQRLRTGDRRRGRAAGVMFLTASVHAGVAGGLAAGAIGLEWPASAVIGAIAAFVVALVTRIVHPGVLTQVAVLGAVTAIAGTVLAWLQVAFFPPPDFSGEFPVRTGPDPIVLVVASAAWWLATAVIIGLIGLREAGRADEDAGSGRRAGVSRLWAGMVAVVGLATAVTQGDMLASGDYGRVVEPWIADAGVAGAGGGPHPARVPSRRQRVRVPRGAGDDHRVDRLQHQLPRWGDRDRPARRRADPAGGRVRGAADPAHDRWLG